MLNDRRSIQKPHSLYTILSTCHDTKFEVMMAHTLELALAGNTKLTQQKICI